MKLELLTEKSQKEVHMDSSKFNMWRALFAFCHIDHKLAAQEEKWMIEKAEHLPFSEEQKALLLKDVKSPPDLNSIIPAVTKPSDRSFLLDQMRVLSRIDGSFSAEEKQKIEEYRSAILAKVNLNELEEKVADDERESYSDDEIYKVDNKHSFFESIHRKVQKMMK